MLNIGNKKYRNMQEQVGWNSERIDKILEFLDGVNLSDNVVVINDMSQILTPEELEVVNKTVSFLVYDGSLYIKKSQDASEAKFDIVFTISGSSVISFNSKEIIVTLSNGALGIVVAAYSVYSVSQIDSLLSAKASISYVDAQLALKASLSGANFTGAITAPSIIQSNEGYQSSSTVPSTKVTVTYKGVVQTGNKVTLVIAGSIATGDDGVATYTNLNLGGFIIPSAVGEKLYPIFDSYLSFSNVDGFQNASTTYGLSGIVVKDSNSILRFILSTRATALPANKTVYFRQEVTFLLSNNLAQ